MVRDRTCRTHVSNLPHLKHPSHPHPVYPADRAHLSDLVREEIIRPLSKIIPCVVSSAC